MGTSDDLLCSGSFIYARATPPTCLQVQSCILQVPGPEYGSALLTNWRNDHSKWSLLKWQSPRRKINHVCSFYSKPFAQNVVSRCMWVFQCQGHTRSCQAYNDVPLSIACHKGSPKNGCCATALCWHHYSTTLTKTSSVEDVWKHTCSKMCFHA